MFPQAKMQEKKPLQFTTGRPLVQRSGRFLSDYTKLISVISAAKHSRRLYNAYIYCNYFIKGFLPVDLNIYHVKIKMNRCSS